MKNLEARIRKLEAETGAAAHMSVILRCFNAGDLTALVDVRGGKSFLRDPGEAEEAFRERAATLALAVPSDGCSMSILREVRG